MAAALRFAARRLGGRALQRAQAIYTASASTAAGEGHLIRTVVPTSSRRSAACAARAPTGNATKVPCAKSAAELLDGSKEKFVRTQQSRIQKKKEELFNLITELDSNVPSRCTRVNRQLAMELSTQVEPKPNDPQWRWYRGAKRLNNCILYGGLATLVLAVCKDFRNTYRQKYPED